MFDALIHRQNGEIAGIGKTTGAKEALEIDEDAIVAVGCGINAVHEIRTRNVEAILGNFRFVKIQEIVGFVAEQFCDLCHNSISFWLCRREII
jgi:hypothetical protein